MRYTPIHVHSDHSLLDGIATVDEIAKAAKRLKAPACALTDHGTTTGLILFQDACKKHGVKPILGVELYCNDSRDDPDDKIKSNDAHIVLLVKNKIGWKNLSYIVSEANINGFHRRPKTTNQIIWDNHEGLIITTACMGGVIAKELISENGSELKARKLVKKYKKVFGDDFYLELQINELDEQKIINEKILELADEFDVKTVIGVDSHYALPKDNILQDVFLMMKFNQNEKDFYSQGKEFSTRSLYMKSSRRIFEEKDELGYDIPDEIIEESLENTNEIADKCNFELEFEKFHFPKFLDDPDDEIELLEELSYDGFDKFIQQGKIPLREYEKYNQQLNKELDVIVEKGFCPYFLVLHDIMQFCEKQGIFTGAGRGSSAGSLVSYLLGITRIDPIKRGLYFERFLDPNKKDMPDVDIDFESERKNEVEKYIVEKYGEENTCKIVSFNTIQIKKSLETLTRLMDIPLDLKDVVFRARNELPEINASFDDFKQVVKSNPKLSPLIETVHGQKIMDLVERLIGRVSNYGTHAAGIIITPEPVYNYMPIQKVKDVFVSTFTEGTREKNISRFGLLKIDILGLTNLSIMKDALQFISDRYPEEEPIDLNEIDLDNPELYQYLMKGKTKGIFQLESDGMVGLIRDVKPTCFEDIVAINALYRPATLASGQPYQFAHNKNNPDDIAGISTIHPELEDILKETYGILTFQEQVIDIFYRIGGFDLVKANQYAKYFYKGLMDQELLHKIQREFIKGAERLDIHEDHIFEIWKVMREFSTYSFNKAHAASYAVIAMQNVYLKLYYYVDYMAALLTHTPNNKKKTEKESKFYKHIKSIKKDGYKVLPVDILKSYHKCVPERKKGIRLGFTTLKGVGDKASLELEEKKYKITKIENLFDGTLDGRKVSKSVIVALVSSGACDSLYDNRGGLLKFIEHYYSVTSTKRKRLSKEIFNKEYFDHPDLNFVDKLNLEKEYYEFYPREHPFDSYKEQIDSYNENVSPKQRLKTPSRFPKSSGVKIAGLVTSVSAAYKTKNGGRMKFVEIGDSLSSIKLVMFDSEIKRYGKYFKEGNAVCFSCDYNIKYNSVTIREALVGETSVVLLDELFENT